MIDNGRRTPTFGATGEFPRGKLDPTDNGEITLGVAFDPEANLVRIEFGTPVAWLAMDRNQAIALARSILLKAGIRKIELS
jgi:hypothetical protein